MPSGHDEMGAALESAGGGVRGVSSGVASAEAVAGAATAGDGEALRALRVVVKGRVAAADVVRASGWAVICRVASPEAFRRQVRQIMVGVCGGVWCVGLVVPGWGALRVGIGGAKNFYGGRDQPSAQFRYQTLLR